MATKYHITFFPPILQKTLPCPNKTCQAIPSGDVPKLPQVALSPRTPRTRAMSPPRVTFLRKKRTTSSRTPIALPSPTRLTISIHILRKGILWLLLRAPPYAFHIAGSRAAPNRQNGRQVPPTNRTI